MLDPERRDDLVQKLLDAERYRAPLFPFTDTMPDFSLTDAYGVQRAIVGQKVAAGAKVVGWKAGFTSAPMREQMGVAAPNYGCLLDSVFIAGELHIEELINPRVEPEIAFVMGEDVFGPGVTPDRILQATRWVCGCMEVVDSRFAGYRFRLEDNTADNSSSARLVIGETLVPVDGLDLRLIGAVLEKDGEVLLTGAGAAALGHPARSVAWIANELAKAGEGLRAGQVVISGGLTSAPFIGVGDSYTASFDRLGSVSLQGV